MIVRTVICLLLALGVAHADAKKHADAGLAAFSAKDFDTASREFEAAYDIDPDPRWLYAWAQSRRLAGDCTKAVSLYKRYLKAKLNDAQITAAKRQIEQCEASEPVAEPDDEPEPEPDPEPRPKKQKEKPPAQVAAPSPWYRDGLGMTLIVGGTLVTGAGLTSYALGVAKEDEANAAVNLDEFRSIREQADFRRNLGIAFVGGGVAMFVGAVIRYKTRKPATAATVTVSGSTVQLYVRF